MKTGRPPARSPLATPWRLRFILLGGGIAWFAHLALAYLIAEFGVLTGLHGTTWNGLSAVVWLLASLSVLMFGLAAFASHAAWSARASARGLTGLMEEASHASRFCTRFGLATNLAFMALIAIQSIPIFYFLRP